MIVTYTWYAAEVRRGVSGARDAAAGVSGQRSRTVVVFSPSAGRMPVPPRSLNPSVTSERAMVNVWSGSYL